MEEKNNPVNEEVKEAIKEEVTSKAPQENAAPKPQKEKPLKKSKGRFKKILIYLVAIFLIVVVTNPNVLVFLPEDLATTLNDAAISVFGDVSTVADMIKIDWSVLFQLGIMIVLLLLIHEILSWIFEKVNPAGGRAKTIKDLIVSTEKYLIALIGFFWGLYIVGVNVSTLFASLGILALIVGFGAESLIADVVTGLFIIFENQYNVGDIVELDGYRGTVVNISIRTTSIKDSGDNIKIINNSEMRNIINLSNEGSFAVCDIPIPYNADIDEAEHLIEALGRQLTKDYPEIFLQAVQCSGVQQWTDKLVMLRVSAKVREENRFKAARIMNKTMKIGLEKANLGVPHAK